MPGNLNLIRLLKVLLLIYISLYLVLSLFEQVSEEHSTVSYEVSHALNVRKTEESKQIGLNLTHEQDGELLQLNSSSNIFQYNAPSSAVPPFELSDWSEESFCGQYVSRKVFTNNVSLCKERVRCSSTIGKETKSTICYLKNLAVNASASIPHHCFALSNNDASCDGVFWLAPAKTGIRTACDSKLFKSITIYDEYVKKITKQALITTSTQMCQKWIDGNTFFFMGSEVHVYFKFLAWYNLANSVPSNEAEYNIIRLPETQNSYLFAEFEKKLFPSANVHSIDDLRSSNNKVMCFRQVTIVPSAYYSAPFRCKMSKRLRDQCFKCNGQGLVGTSLQSFRRRVLNACSIADNNIKKISKKRTFVLLLRKPYHRFINDNSKRFQRELINSVELQAALVREFPNDTILNVSLEKIPICDQINIANKADILLGVHGAGLVHLWWMKSTSLVFEIVPHTQTGNPSFKMLSTLLGRRYYGFTSGVREGKFNSVIVNVHQLISELKTAMQV